MLVQLDLPINEGRSAPAKWTFYLIELTGFVYFILVYFINTKFIKREKYKVQKRICSANHGANLLHGVQVLVAGTDHQSRPPEGEVVWRNILHILKN